MQHCPGWAWRALSGPRWWVQGPAKWTAAWGPWTLPACAAPVSHPQALDKDLVGLEYVPCTLGGLPLCPGHQPRVILSRELPTPMFWERLKAGDRSHALGLSRGRGSALPGASSTRCWLRTCPPSPPPPSLHLLQGWSLPGPHAACSGLGLCPRRRQPARPDGPLAAPAGRPLTRAADPGGGCAAAPAGRATWRGPRGWRRGPGPAPRRGAAAARGAPWSEKPRGPDTAGERAAGAVRAPASRGRLSTRSAGSRPRGGTGKRPRAGCPRPRLPAAPPAPPPPRPPPPAARSPASRGILHRRPFAPPSRRPPSSWRSAGS